MSDDAVKSWMPSTTATVAYAVRKLLKEGNHELAVGILIIEILKGKFASVINFLAMNTEVSEAGIRTLLADTTADSYATRMVFESAGLPPAMYPLFATSIDLVQEVVRVRKTSLSPQVTSFVLEKVLSSKAVEELTLNDSLVAYLRTYAGTAADHTALQEQLPSEDVTAASSQAPQP